MKTALVLFIVLFSTQVTAQMKACDWFKFKQKIAMQKMNDLFGTEVVAERFEIDTSGYVIDYGKNQLTYQDTTVLDTSRYHALQFPFWFKISNGTSTYRLSGVMCDYDLDGGFDFDDEDIPIYLSRNLEKVISYETINALIKKHFKTKKDELEFYFYVRKIDGKERFLLNIGWPTVYHSNFRPCSYDSKKSIEVDAVTGELLQVRAPSSGHTF